MSKFLNALTCVVMSPIVECLGIKGSHCMLSLLVGGMEKSY